MRDRLTQLYDSAGPRDVVEIAILAVAIFLLLRLLGKSRGASVVRGLGLLAVGLFLVAQVLVGIFDLSVLGRVLDYLLTTLLVALLVIFQPELRRGLMVLGRYRLFRYLVPANVRSVSSRLADAARAMSIEGVGALVAVEREMTLGPYADTGERLDAELSSLLVRSLFAKRSPLHDGAVVVCGGRITAAACQLPLGQPPENASGQHMGMRHRSALALSEETDAVLLVVSEETGRISLAVGGKLEAVPHDQLGDRLAELLETRSRTRVQKSTVPDQPAQPARRAG